VVLGTIVFLSLPVNQHAMERSKPVHISQLSGIAAAGETDVLKGNSTKAKKLRAEAESLMEKNRKLLSSKYVLFIEKGETRNIPGGSSAKRVHIGSDVYTLQIVEKSKV